MADGENNRLSNMRRAWYCGMFTVTVPADIQFLDRNFWCNTTEETTNEDIQL